MNALTREQLVERGLRRFQVHYGRRGDGGGYVVTDRLSEGRDWRGEIVFRTNSKSEALTRADELNTQDAREINR